MDYKNFCKSIVHVHGDLEEYLRKILEIVENHNKKILEWQDMIDILTLKASGKNKGKKNFVEKKKVIQRLEKQIKDLHDMQENGDLDKEFKYFGLTSPSGEPWYNFDPATYLRCGAAGLFRRKIPTCNWDILEHFLLLGQIYE